MSSNTALSEWEQSVQAADSGESLLAFLRDRLDNPYTVGPSLDDRRGEGPEEVFERLAGESEVFREKLDRTIADFVRSEASDPSHAQDYALLYGILLMTEHLALTGVFAPLRVWLERHAAILGGDDYFGLASTALGALAISQPRGLREARAFWLGWWKKAPPSWIPSVFIGLRLQDPKTALEHLEELLLKAEAQKQNPGALLHGFWKSAPREPKYPAPFLGGD